VASPAAADWSWSGHAGTVYNDNVTRAQDAQDKRSDVAITAALAATRFHPLNSSDALTFGLQARAEVYARYYGLSNMVIGGTAAYRRKFGLGAAAPWVAITLGASYDDYRDDLRTSTRVDGRMEIGQRFGARIDATAGITIERRFDDNGEAIVPGISGRVFDLMGQGAFVRAGYTLTDALYLDVRAGVRRGDVESTSQRSTQVFLASDAIAPDPAFGDPALVAYRLRGTTWSGALTGSYALSDRASLNATYSQDFTRAAQGLEYTSHLVTLSFAYRH
jgi:hypothetical protein